MLNTFKNMLNWSLTLIVLTQLSYFIHPKARIRVNLQSNISWNCNVIIEFNSNKKNIFSWNFEYIIKVNNYDKLRYSQKCLSCLWRVIQQGKEHLKLE